MSTPDQVALSTTVEKLIIVRHGQRNTENGSLSQVRGTPLTPEGEKEARKTGIYLRNNLPPVSVIVTSPMYRTARTAHKILQEQHTKSKELYAYNGVGEWIKDGSVKRHPQSKLTAIYTPDDLLQKLKQHKYANGLVIKKMPTITSGCSHLNNQHHFGSGRGETRSQHRYRVTIAMRELFLWADAQNKQAAERGEAKKIVSIVIVSHADTIHAISSFLCPGLPGFHCGTCSITELDHVANGKWTPIRAGYKAHAVGPAVRAEEWSVLEKRWQAEASRRSVSSTTPPRPQVEPRTRSNGSLKAPPSDHKHQRDESFQRNEERPNKLRQKSSMHNLVHKASQYIGNKPEPSLRGLFRNASSSPRHTPDVMEGIEEENGDVEMVEVQKVPANHVRKDQFSFKDQQQNGGQAQKQKRNS